MSLYETIVENGIYHYSEEDTLYFPANSKTRDIVANYPLKDNVREFYCEKSGVTWFEAKLANDRYWEEKIQNLKKNRLLRCNFV